MQPLENQRAPEEIALSEAYVRATKKITEEKQETHGAIASVIRDNKVELEALSLAALFPPKRERTEITDNTKEERQALILREMELRIERDSERADALASLMNEEITKYAQWFKARIKEIEDELLALAQKFCEENPESADEDSLENFYTDIVYTNRMIFPEEMEDNDSMLTNRIGLLLEAEVDPLLERVTLKVLKSHHERMAKAMEDRLSKLS